MGALARRDRPDLLPEEREETREMLRREILALWQTDELRRKRLTPVDEAKAGLVLFDQILWDAVPVFLREVDRGIIERITFHNLDSGYCVLRVQANDESGEGGAGFQCCWTNAYVKVTVQ